MIIPFPPFEPDKSPFNASATDNVINCLPVADGWGGMPSLVEKSDALPSECLGAVFVRKTNGNIEVYAGTTTNLYLLDTSVDPWAWTEVSKSTGAYTVPTGDLWQFTKFGPYLIACQLGDTPQYVNIDSGGNFADLTSAPNARYVWNAGDFVVLGHLTSAPNTVQWSGLNDATYWTNGQRGADIQVIPDGGEIMGGIGDQRGALVIQRDAMRFMQFAPASGYTFTFSQANSKRGAVAPNSIVQVGQNQFVYLSEDGFFSGIDGQPIGAERVDNWFLDDLDRDYMNSVKGMADPFNKIVWWRYRSLTGTSKLIGYDWQLDRWCYSDEQITAAAALATPDSSWDGLSDEYASIDSISVPFDSILFKGGKPVFAGFTSDNKLAFSGGGNLAATIETAWIEPVSGRRSFVSEGRVIGNAVNHTVAVGTVPFHGGTETYKSAVSPSSRTGRLPLRADSRLHRYKLAIAADEAWNIVSGFEAKFNPGGRL